MNHGYDPYDYGDYDAGAYKTPTHYQVKRGWDTGDAPKVCENCDWMPKDNKQKILMDHGTWRVLMALCSTVKVEWQALLKGTIDDKGVVLINGYYIPKQEVGPASVKNLDIIDDVFIRENGIVAGVHSHANMAVFFSTTDHTDTNMSLIKHNIVVNNKGEYKALSRVELPCGMVKFIEATVFTVGEPDVAIEGADRIVEKSYGFKGHTDYWAPPLKDDREVAGKSKPQEDAMRWCTVCSMTPEEDSGASCTCWTKGDRCMLPDFTVENYEKSYGRTWNLKDHLYHKFGKGSGTKK